MVIGDVKPKAFEIDLQFDGTSQLLGRGRQRLDVEDAFLSLYNNNRCILRVYILGFRRWGLESKV